mgnify:CR=1 FL=1|tara:strand:- start:257 stop:556 length:300 start_codon:yes stop_codon:yes gene_type:complete
MTIPRDFTKWMTLKGCKTWCSNPKHGPFLQNTGVKHPEDNRKARITFTCEGNATSVSQFLCVTLSRRLERAFDDHQRKKGHLYSTTNTLKFEIIEEEEQ